MSKREAEQRTKYFGEGVSVETGSNRDGDTAIVRVDREGSHVFWFGIDDLMRSVRHVRNQIQRGDEKPELFASGDFYPELIVTFVSHADAVACIKEIGDAVRYVQDKSKNERWFQVGMDVFNVAQPANQ